MTPDLPMLTCSPGSPGSALPLNGPDSEPSLSLKSTLTPAGCSPTGGQASPISVTSDRSTGGSFETRMARLIALRQGFLASLLACSESGVEIQTNAGSGQKQSDALASYDPGSASLRTRQLSLLSTEGGPSTELHQSWSRAGMICSGSLYPLPPLVQDTFAGDSSSSELLPTLRANKRGVPDSHGDVSAWDLPTPTTSTGGKEPAGSTGRKLLTVASNHLLPTPTTRDWKDTPGMATETGGGRCRIDQLPRAIFADGSTVKTGGMRLTPEFQCWLMGFPPDWLKPLRDALGTPSSRKRSTRSSKPSTISSTNP